MSVKRHILFSVSLGILALIASGYQKQTQAIYPEFDIVSTATGVTLYRDSPDYVQVVNLSQGANVKFLHGEVTNLGQCQGAYKGDNPKFELLTITQAWNKFLSKNQQAFSIINGQFFKPTKDNSTSLAFPLKVDGKVISDGYAGEGEYPSQKMMLEVWNNHADITKFEPKKLYSSNAPNMIVGLAEDADKGIKNEVGRTFVGVKDGNSDGLYETIILFSSAASSQTHASETLKKFGAFKVVMLDGGSSSQLLSQGKMYVQSKSQRTIPQTIGVISGNSISNVNKK